MGGSSSSSAAKNYNTNVSGQNAIQGDNLGVAISGVNGSTINATVTDHNAVNRSFDLADNSMSKSFEFAEESLNAVTEAQQDAMQAQAVQSSESMQMLQGLAGNQAEQNAKSIKALKELAQKKRDQESGGNESAQQTFVWIVALSVVGMSAVTFMAVRSINNV
ncbi:hypothetical protein BZG76_06030 [Salinivibrio sp. AR647]|uniref:hypothetical protein n=1 Tax=Salinivibrio sp. AR647 TaxID=1909438 RepID=UPI0009873B63|nr:hypothetical protein [Salinivibrio sp. AR647]OOE92839.1 hypothetical protein BZG76_06030 [Salinivibrio sp. AR647]